MFEKTHAIEMAVLENIEDLVGRCHADSELPAFVDAKPRFTSRLAGFAIARDFGTGSDDIRLSLDT